LKFDLDTVQYAIEPVGVFRPALQAHGDVVDGCLRLSSWLSKQYELTVFESINVWLLHTCGLKKKAYYL